MMMTFCKKSVHSFLGIPPPTAAAADSDHLPVSPLSPPCGRGLGLIDSPVHRPPNVVESASVAKPCKFTDGGGGIVVDGLTSCTESLGFESCGDTVAADFCSSSGGGTGDAGGDLRWRERIRERRRRREAGKAKKFPPPISSLNKNGQPNFFLRPVRRNGRLELTEVRIDRPEVLRATREDGRLRLLLVRDGIEIEEEDGETAESKSEDSENTELELELELELDSIEEVDDQVGETATTTTTASFCGGSESEATSVAEEEGEEEGIGKVELLMGEEWSFPVSGEGFRRCYDLVNRGHVGGGHHQYPGGEMHMWRQHCVTTR